MALVAIDGVVFSECAKVAKSDFGLASNTLFAWQIVHVALVALTHIIDRK